jgi:putative addiction module component (TIGR02574 family)
MSVPAGNGERSRNIERARLSGAAPICYSIAMSALTKEAIARMTPPERLDLIGDLCDSLDDAATPLSEQQRVEIERRLQASRDDPSGALDWRVFKQELAHRSQN